MARESVIYAKYNPEVFEVGRGQAMLLLHEDWELSIFKYRCNYVVVCALSWFGCSPSLHEVAGYDTLEGAVECVEHQHEHDMLEIYRILPYEAFGADYEVWHLVDDGELWDEWELKVQTFRELAERKEEETRKLYSGELGVNVSAFLKHYATCQNVKRDMSEIVRIGRLITSSLGGNYELHDLVDYDRLLSSGSIWELFVYDGCTFHVWRFASERDYLFFVERHEEMLSGFGSFVYRYLYGADGLFAYEDMQSDEGAKSIWESIPGGELDEDIVF